MTPRENYFKLRAEFLAMRDPWSPWPKSVAQLDEWHRAQRRMFSAQKKWDGYAEWRAARGELGN